MRQVNPRVLNALRHQWNLHRTARARTPRARGAQRLAASMESSHALGRDNDRAVPCSTPCGINGIFTAVRGNIGPEAGAQRLAASMESSRQADAGLSLSLHRCSTPCGINGIFTQRRIMHSKLPIVLNALRHQWNLHQLRSATCPRQWRAQRLAASMESSRER